MADRRITEHTELAAQPATGDWIEIVDVSDTTDAATGTNKRINRANLLGTVLAATTASYTTVSESKLAGIEAAATADQSAAEILAALLTVDGAGSGLDADTLDGSSSADFATAGHNHTGTYQPLDTDLTTLATAFSSASASGPATLALAEDTDNGTNKVTISAPASVASDVTVTVPALAGTVVVAATDGPDNGGLSIGNVGAIESNVNTVASSGSTETLDTSLYAVHDVTMSEACTFTFSNPAASGKATLFTLILRGAFTPTWPAAVDWPDATQPTYTTPSIYTFMTVDGGTIWLGAQAGKAFG